MKRRSAVPMILGAVGMMTLIFDGKTAVAGAQAGIGICLQSLIPSLFPFFVLSALITGNLAGQSGRFLRFIARLCRIPEGTESLFLVGILGGYPMGAKCINDCCQKKQINLEDGVRMAVFCNNAGPSFIFGILSPFFSGISWAWAIWVVQIFSAIITARLLPGGSSAPSQAKTCTQTPLHSAVSGAIGSMLSVCGWVVLFRMILEFMTRWFLWLLPAWGQVLVTGFLELSNGCLGLQNIVDESVRFILANLMLSMGGLCVCMQTKAVFPQLPMGTYIFGRILHCGICLTLSVLLIPLLTGRFSVMIISVVVFPVLAILLPKIRKKVVAIPG